jgi:hypothetical protein
MPLVMSAKAKRFMQMGSRANQFAARVVQYEQDAAKEATAESRQIYARWHSGRPIAPPRNGRPTTMGQFGDLLLWERAGNGLIEFDLAGLKSRAPYALIQEIGTNQSASILNGPMAGSLSVRSQRGRHISAHLMWADAQGGTASRPMTGKNRSAAQATGSIGMQQLFERPKGSYGRAGLIRREIKGKHFIRDGGIAGYDLLRDRLVSDFNKTFK